ncbi:BTB/POZ domain-containing protein 2 isoform X2 [Anabrus simplex]|uniref:BTB/POZ domain-containing protein 2 isoform X2 n=1 Tax=Anabrus simplex TaxID=316456 RepID=UPI0035A3815F
MAVQVQPGRSLLVADLGYVKQVPTVGTSPNKVNKMCPNENTGCSVPLLLERSDSCVDSEVNSDVTFLVGQGSELSRVPGHRSVLAAASPVFRAMFEGMLADGPIVNIPDVERRAFDHLLRHMYGEEVQLQSVGTALTTLYAAHKYQCEGLERLCITYLSSHLDPTCVLDIYHDMLFYNHAADTLSQATMQHGNNWAPSAPPLNPDDIPSDVHQNVKQEVPVPVQTKTFSTSTSISALYAELLNNCLRYIDCQADQVLQQEQLEELNEDELRFIAQRDTLGISSEQVLFKALERWCNCKCKCNQWELSPEKRRKALGKDLLFSVRFLLMTSEEFMSGPMRSKLLDQDESSILLQHILKHNEIQRPSKYLEDVLPMLRRPRQKPTPLVSEAGFDSAQSSCGSSKSASSRGSLSGTSSKSSKKELRRQRRQRRIEERNLDERKQTFTDYFFSCVACIFD